MSEHRHCKPRIRACTLLGLLLIPSLLAAQPGALRFQHLGAKDGLSQNNASAIAQDDFGFLWFATQDGLNRYDGYEFISFTTDADNPRSIGHNYVSELLVTRDGSIWVGSRGGLHRFLPETQSFVNYYAEPGTQGALPDEIVTMLFQDSENRLWIGTERGGLSRFDQAADRFVTYQQDPDQPGSISQNHVTAMLETADGSLLVGTQDGLNRFDADTGLFEIHSRAGHVGGISDDRINALVQQSNGTIWVGTTNGLNRIDRDDAAIQAIVADEQNPHSLAHNAINTLFEDSNGNLWIGTKGGLSLWSGDGSFINYHHQQEDPSSIASDDIVALYEDMTGVIWIGHDGAGINRVDPLGMGFAHIGIGLDHPGGVVYPHVWAILVDSRNELWIGSETGGFSHYRGEDSRFEHFVSRPQDPNWLGSNHVNAIIEDDRGMMWIGTDFAGLHQYDRNTNTFQRFQHDPDNPESLANNNIYALLEDRRNHLWIATNSGVDRLDPRRRRFTHFPHDPDNPESLSDTGVRSLFESRDGSIWVGTRRGLNRIDPLSGRIQRIVAGIDGDQALARHWVLSIQQGRDDSIWAGTLQGLYRLRANGELSHITQKDGLPNDTIYGQLIDDSDRIWLSTNRGIAMYDPASQAIETYDISHGLQANEFNQGAFFQSASGDMLFGGINGVTSFHPDEITRDPFPPRVVITDFRLFNRPVQVSTASHPTPLQRHITMTDRLVLDYRQSVFTFDFTALHFADPDRNQYAYRLLGLSDDWIETNARRRSATFTSLPAGDYIFQVRGSNRAGIWSDPPAEVQLRVLSPPWRTNWAYAGYALMLALVVGSVARAQLSKSTERAAAQRAIAKSEERLRLALWGSGDELWDWDFAQGQISRLNHNEADLQDVVTEPLAGLEGIGERIHPDDFPALSKALRQHLAGDTPHFEATCRTRDGQGGWTWVIERGRVVERDDLGNPIRVAGTSKDISPLKSAEEALRDLNERLEERVTTRTEALQKANSELTETIHRLRETQSQLTEAEKMASLGNLVAGVAHEINTPVGVSVTAASHLVEQTRRFQARMETDDLPLQDVAAYQQSSKACAELILRNLERAAQLISSFKQVAVDQSSERRRKFDLSTYLGEILISLQPRIDRSSHEVELDCPDMILMNTFPGALYQVLSNLIINSLTHAFEEGQQGTIRIAAVALGDESVRLYYRDNGKGLSDDVRQHIFEPFFTTRRGSGGSGLGMHIVYNLVTQALRGTIVCGDAPGGGALFEMEIPKVLDSRSDSEAPDAAQIQP